jgi:NAD(P)-dependent dehydrogenase (short-subunit alcohol dehydrogenase family)
LAFRAVLAEGTTVQVSLEGKVSIVTGAGNLAGIGAAYAFGLARSGSGVVVADIHVDGALEVAEQLAAEGHRAIGLQVDITDPDSVAAMVTETVSTFGGVDVLVNNAAMMAEITQVPAVEMSLDEWQRVLDVNLTGALVCSQAVVPVMRARGGGRIVNQVSGGAFVPRNAYGVTKLGLVGLTVVLARELGPDAITVNAIAPGFVASDAGNRIAPPGSPFRTALAQTVAMREVGSPDDLVGPLLLLVSDEGSWITGQTLNVDGGWVMRI